MLSNNKDEDGFRFAFDKNDQVVVVANQVVEKTKTLVLGRLTSGRVYSYLKFG